MFLKNYYYRYALKINGGKKNLKILDVLCVFAWAFPTIIGEQLFDPFGAGAKK